MRCDGLFHQYHKTLKCSTLKYPSHRQYHKTRNLKTNGTLKLIQFYYCKESPQVISNNTEAAHEVKKMTAQTT